MLICKCAAECVLLAANILYGFATFATFFYSVYVCFIQLSYREVLDNNEVAIISLLMTCGSVTFIFSIWGCFSAIKREYICLIIYACCMISTAIFHLIVGIFGRKYITSFEKNFDINMEEFFKSKSDYKNYSMTSVLFMEKLNNCCGLNGERILPPNWPDIPGLSCQDKNGCKKKVKENVREHLLFLIICAAILFLIELLCAALAIIITCF
ncbi:hypothetical protein O3M35_003417 [Rhynocoris fuscipes]|uniref:Tetraspanin n=1 Tax=Rhynocoris fuscipes TaxID=488301 RepID=A0AAW1CKC6_9HEMI